MKIKGYNISTTITFKPLKIEKQFARQDCRP